jgi:RNA polymerase sigma-70 factor (ECF subfamily)
MANTGAFRVLEPPPQTPTAWSASSDVPTTLPTARPSPGSTRLGGHALYLVTAYREVAVSALSELADEELVARARAADADGRQAALEVLYGRYYARVASWCVRFSGRREEAAELAQEVFLRVHDRLDSFRGDSRFSTWLYLVTRSVVINRGQTAARRRTESLDEEGAVEPFDPTPAVADVLADGQVHAELRRAMREDLEPLEGRAFYLHFVSGMTLDRVTALLGLTNKSGAKALVVSAKRKLHRGFGRWLAAQSTPTELDSTGGRP